MIRLRMGNEPGVHVSSCSLNNIYKVLRISLLAPVHYYHAAVAALKHRGKLLGAAAEIGKESYLSA